MAMKVGVLGTGDVGRALARGFLARRHHVMFGTRDPKKQAILDLAASAGAGASVGTFKEAARFGDVVVLATKGAVNRDVLKAAGPDNLAGKLVIDATNPLEFTSAGPRLLEPKEGSAGAEVQAIAPKARVVKCFNTVGNVHMVDPRIPGGPPTMFIAGNDQAAKDETRRILKDFGWPDAYDCGPIQASRYLEAMVMVWVAAYGARGKGDHAFRIIHP